MSLYDQFRNPDGTLKNALAANGYVDPNLPGAITATRSPFSQGSGTFQGNGFNPNDPNNMVSMGGPQQFNAANAAPGAPHAALPGPALSQVPQTAPLNVPQSYISQQLNPTLFPNAQPMPPALTNAQQITADVEADARAQAASEATKNKRDQTQMSAPLNKISNAEMAIRMGGAMTGASINGGTGAMAAASQVYGDVSDQRRANAMESYKLALEREDAEQAAISEQQAAQQELDREINESVGQMDDMDFRMQEVEDGINFYKAKGETNIFGVGIGDLTNRAKEGVMGGQKESLRMMAQGLVIDATLARTMLTKGAISDSEMKIFREDMPSANAQEGEWLAWIKRARAQLKTSMERMRTGNTSPRESTNWETRYETPTPGIVDRTISAASELIQENEDLFKIGQ